MSIRRTCLVADDEASIRRFLKSILESHGFQVLEALNGVQALHLAERLGDAVDLIVSDVNMPDGDGLTFVWSVRGSYPAIPIVLISGKPLLEQARTPQSGIEFVLKPFTANVLWAAIERAVKTSGDAQDTRTR